MSIDVSNLGVDRMSSAKIEAHKYTSLCLIQQHGSWQLLKNSSISCIATM